MASATAVGPPATDPDYRKPLEPAGPAAGPSGVLGRATSAAQPSDELQPKPAHGSRRVSVILHGKRADESDVRAAVAALRKEGVRVDVKVTWESGDVEKFVKDIVKARSTDTIVAAGGDGTLNEVVAALIKVKAPRDIAVGLMPMGTSNDFAAVTGLPQDLEGALRLCTRSDNLHPLDVGLLNGEVFMNTATLGASSELGSETSHEAKKLLGPAAYLVKGIARLAGYTAVPVRMRFPAPPPSAAPSRSQSAPGAAGEGGAAAGAGAAGAKAGEAEGVARGSKEESKVEKALRKEEKKKERKAGKTMEIKDEVLNLTAGNSRQLASMVQACPDALLDDGLLDITYITGAASTTASTVVGEILSQGLDDVRPSNVHMMRVPWVEVTVEDPDASLEWPGNRDGEPVPSGRKFLLEALPRRVAMHLPPAASALLTEGADHRVNAPVIAINRLRKGAMRAMLAQVIRFKRIIPGSRPAWQSAAIGVLTRAPPLLLAFGLGWVLSGRRQGNTGEPAAARAGGWRRGGGRRGRPAEAGTQTEESGGGVRGRLPVWLGGRRKAAVVA
ncbi:hypothetical protein HYH03_006475 [Edaphochlamys debaryana]|uniref:DAGKc domain-containing protein n=1 Tax=Edaphochlamys debaryana TaxID=47281 RepID=A0A835Y5K4_9CHLO|nr:hypothetical protein HYH03_006475 [Edaphochlamys debaryana]|eukprot:KAG2495532.1 hypothetical protein HYH03_006475 [Edaphochlamys debaryana]